MLLLAFEFRVAPIPFGFRSARFCLVSSVLICDALHSFGGYGKVFVICLCGSRGRCDCCSSSNSGSGFKRN